MLPAAIEAADMPRRRYAIIRCLYVDAMLDLMPPMFTLRRLRLILLPRCCRAIAFTMRFFAFRYDFHLMIFRRFAAAAFTYAFRCAPHAPCCRCCRRHFHVCCRLRRYFDAAIDAAAAC